MQGTPPGALHYEAAGPGACPWSSRGINFGCKAIWSAEDVGKGKLHVYVNKYASFNKRPYAPMKWDISPFINVCTNAYAYFHAYLCFLRQVWSVSFYFTFYLRTEEMKQKIFQEFVNEELRTGSFPRMTKEQLIDHQDVCGICLEEMRWSGRKTPCNHVFHNHCLSLAISSFTFCPICKYPLWEAFHQRRAGAAEEGLLRFCQVYILVSNLHLKINRTSIIDTKRYKLIL